MYATTVELSEWTRTCLPLTNGRKLQRALTVIDRLDRLYAKFLWSDGAVEGTQVDNGSKDAQFLLGGEEESQNESLALGLG